MSSTFLKHPYVIILPKKKEEEENKPIDVLTYLYVKIQVL